MAEGPKLPQQPAPRSQPAAPKVEPHIGPNVELSGWGLGLEFILSVLVPGAIGYWLDGKFGTRPALMLVGGGIGFAAGLFRMLRQSREIMR